MVILPTVPDTRPSEILKISTTPSSASFRGIGIISSSGILGCDQLYSVHLREPSSHEPAWPVILSTTPILAVLVSFPILPPLLTRHTTRCRVQPAGFLL
jgi:hypothetical protein